MTRHIDPSRPGDFQLVCIQGFVLFLGIGLLLPTFPQHLVHQGHSLAQIGFLSAGFWIAAIVTRLPLGFLLRGRPVSHFIALGGVLTLAAYAAYPWVSALGLVFLVRLLHGLGYSFGIVGLFAAIAALRSGQNAVRGFSTFSIFVFLGYSLGPLIGQGLYDHFGSTGVFLAGAGATLAALALVAGMGPLAASAPGAPPVSAARGEPGLETWRVLLCTGLLALPLAALETFAPLYAKARGAGDIRVFFGVFSLVLIGVRTRIARAGKPASPRVMLALSAALCAGATLSLTLAPNPYSLGGSAVLLGLGWGLYYPHAIALVLASPALRDKPWAHALFTTVFDASFALGQVAVGYLIAQQDYEAGFAVASGFALTASLLLGVTHFRGAGKLEHALGKPLP